MRYEQNLGRTHADCVVHAIAVDLLCDGGEFFVHASIVLH